MSEMFPGRVQRKTNRPQKAKGEPTVLIKATVPVSTRDTLNAACEAEGVSMSYLISEGAVRLANEAYNQRELGLVPVGARITEDLKARLEMAAAASPVSYARWIEGALLHAIEIGFLDASRVGLADDGAAETNSEKAAA